MSLSDSDLDLEYLADQETFDPSQVEPSELPKKAKEWGTNIRKVTEEFGLRERETLALIKDKLAAWIPSSINDVELFWIWFESAYCQNGNEQTVLVDRKLRSLKQTGTIEDYNTEFRQILSLVRLDTYFPSEVAKQCYITGILNQRARQVLLMQMLSSSLDELMSTALALDVKGPPAILLVVDTEKMTNIGRFNADRKAEFEKETSKDAEESEDFDDFSDQFPGDEGDAKPLWIFLLEQFLAGLKIGNTNINIGGPRSRNHGQCGNCGSDGARRAHCGRRDRERPRHWNRSRQPWFTSCGDNGKWHFSAGPCHWRCNHDHGESHQEECSGRNRTKNCNVSVNIIW